jgi:hypothetical protein
MLVEGQMKTLFPFLGVPLMCAVIAIMAHCSPKLRIEHTIKIDAPDCACEEVSKWMDRYRQKAITEQDLRMLIGMWITKEIAKDSE